MTGEHRIKLLPQVERAASANHLVGRIERDLRNARKKPYLNAGDRAEKLLSERHRRKLSQDLMDLHILRRSPAVRSGLAEAASDTQIFRLWSDINRFMARFPNTGVRVFGLE